MRGFSRSGAGALVAVVALVLSSAGADAAWEAKREALKNKSRPLILNADGNEMIYYPTNLPITVESFNAQRLKDYVGTKVSTLSYCPQSSGFGYMTTTRAGEFFDVPLYLPDIRPQCMNAAPAFAAKGLDCLDMTSAFCRTNGMEIFVSIRVNDTHDHWYFRPGTNPKRSWLFPKWKAAHPDCLFGTDRKRPRFGSWTAVDFENPEVRAYMKKFVAEFVNNYDVDGIEYDFMRHGPILKSVGWGAYATEAQLKTMTGFMMELRAITEAAGRKRGKPILVLVRTSDSVGYAKGIGIDVEAWLKAGVMDIWSVSDYFQLDYLKPNAELAHRYGVKFHSALAESRVQNVVKGEQKKGNPARMLPGRNTIASFAAEYAAAKAAGCDGVESFNLSTIWRSVNGSKLLRIDPRKTEGLDKTYFALVRGSGGYLPEGWLKDGASHYRRPRIDPGRPLKIPTDRPFAFGMEFGDESGAKKPKVSVKALFAGDRPTVKALTLNGKALELASCKDGVHAYRADVRDLKVGLNTFEVVPNPAVGDWAVFQDFAVYVEHGGSRR